MRIQKFASVIFQKSENHVLKNSAVVIDGQNFFYNLYEQSKLPFQFGCECNRYAEYLKEYLSMFVEANVKCYIIFKGAHELQVNVNKLHEGRKYRDGDKDTISPIFKKSVYNQVLDEMGFQYVICEYESKKDVIALAQKLKCPIVSNDAEFSFSGVPYITSISMKYNAMNKSIQCKIFRLDNFLRIYNLTEKKVAIFIVITDEKIFPCDHFEVCFKNKRNFTYTSTKMQQSRKYHIRNEELLRWLSNTDEERALNDIFEFLSTEDITMFKQKLEEVIHQIVRRNETGDFAVEYLQNGNKIDVTFNDPKWFVKGVALRYIAISYVNLYRKRYIIGSWAIEDDTAEDSMMLSIKIIKYAYDLLTNYQNENLRFLAATGEKTIGAEYAIKKPIYNANQSVFENGWDHLPTFDFLDGRSGGLFEYFILKEIAGFDLDTLDTLPEDVRLLMISLVYFACNKLGNTDVEVYSVLLSYVMLGFVFEKRNKPSKSNFYSNISSTIDPHSSTELDCKKAAEIMAPYFNITQFELKEIFDKKLLHSLVEFQHCLNQINYLSRLCNSSYKQTVYSKTYNATFVYKLLYLMKKTDDPLKFITNQLDSAPTVLAFFKGLLEAYNKLIDF